MKQSQYGFSRKRNLSGVDQQKKKINFTIIELLVVISIIAVLASILLPALNSARLKGKAVACVGNQKQLGQIFAMYSNDNKDILYVYGGGNIYDPLAYDWARAYYMYYNSRHKSSFSDLRMTVRFWMCPLNPVNPADFLSRHSYGMKKDGYSEEWENGAFLLDGVSSGVLVTRVKQTSRYFLLGDSVCFNYSNASYIGKGFYYLSLNSHGFHLRHSTRANLLFIDGHVAALSGGDLYQMKQDADSARFPSARKEDYRVSYF